VGKVIEARAAGAGGVVPGGGQVLAAVRGPPIMLSSQLLQVMRRQADQRGFWRAR